MPLVDIPHDPSHDILNKVIFPVYTNTIRVRDALGIYSAITQNAAELNKTHHKMYFALTQRLSIDYAIICLCKLYDKSCKDYDKHTISNLLKEIRKSFYPKSFQQINAEAVFALGVSIKKYRCIHINRNPDKQIDRLFSLIESQMPTENNTAALKNIFTIRNKVLAHQENLFVTDENLPEDLPPIDELENLNSWAINLCLFATEVLCQHTILDTQIASSKIATLKIIAKALNKDFSDLEMMQSFYCFGSSKQP